MTKTSYSEKLKHPKWQKRRLEVFQRDNFCCAACKDSESTLHVHHKSYSGNPWDADFSQLITLCEDCHWVYESLKKENIIPKIVFKKTYSKDPVIKSITVIYQSTEVDELETTTFVIDGAGKNEMSHRLGFGFIKQVYHLMKSME